MKVMKHCLWSQGNNTIETKNLFSPNSLSNFKRVKLKYYPVLNVNESNIVGLIYLIL